MMAEEIDAELLIDSAPAGTPAGATRNSQNPILVAAGDRLDAHRLSTPGTPDGNVDSGHDRDSAAIAGQARHSVLCGL
jgi:hypothetical protein